MSVTILAPHGDDEIIGCFTDLIQPWQITVLFGEIDEGCAFSAKRHGFSFALFDHKAMLCDDSDWDIVYAPDPVYEHHPKHQWFGQVAQQLFREGRIDRLRLYATTMRAPYIMDLGPEMAEDKRQALVRCYPSKSDLWKMDHRYFLFEGCIEWRRRS